MDFKDIHMGNLLNLAVTESGIEMSRICNFLKSTQEEVEVMYASKSLDTEVLLRWSKLLEYDFFRIYSQHLILYAPPSKKEKNIPSSKVSTLPEFRKNLYTKEVIDFILELILKGEKTRKQIMDEYQIPKTTLYKWISKYKK